LAAVPHNRLVIFPMKKPSTMFHYCDSVDKGKSSVLHCAADNRQLQFEYILRPGFESPYAGFEIEINRDTNGIDISHYDNVTIGISPGNTRKILCYIKLFVPGKTIMENYLTQRYLEEEIDLSVKKERYVFSLKKMKTSRWWLKENNVSESQIGPPDFSRFINMCIESSPYTPTDIRYIFTVQKIYLTKDNTRIYAMAILLCCLYYGVFWFFVRTSLNKKAAAVIPYREVSMGNYIDEEAQRITECIIRDFNDSELTVTKVGLQAGIASSKIPLILKKKFNQSFKQYLNHLRLTEARRMLRETNKSISDIAYSVGYKNVTHFHRIFKLFENVSPNEYRKQEEKKEDAATPA
jgi:YesN/AraC family two-component response regulator